MVNQSAMNMLHNRSRKAIVAITLLAWFGPALFLLPQLLKNGVSGRQAVLICPLMYGFTTSMWFQAVDRGHWAGWLNWTATAVCSLAYPAGFVILMLRADRRRPAILAGGLLIAIGLATMAYWLLRA